jgi:hypothetical protein
MHDDKYVHDDAGARLDRPCHQFNTRFPQNVRGHSRGVCHLTGRFVFQFARRRKPLIDHICLSLHLKSWFGSIDYVAAEQLDPSSFIRGSLTITLH